MAKKTDNEKENVAKRFYDLNIKGRKSTYVDRLKAWCCIHLKNINGKDYTYKDVVCALPDEIEQLALFSKKMGYDDSISELKYISENLYGKMHGNAQKVLFETLDSEICPYCNRNYVYVDSRMKACDFDHFFPKSLYPLISASFYNLIPACAVCNRQKSDKELVFDPYRNYLYEDLPHFRVWIKRSDYLENNDSLEIEIDGRDKFEPDLELLKLKELYASHRNIVRDVMIKKYVYSEEYIKELNSNFKDIFVSDEQIRDILCDIPTSPENFGKKTLSKLKYEVWYS